MKKNSGITLIALVITIVIMLIIATISVTMLAGDNSLIHNAGEAKEGVEEKNEKDIINLAVTTVMNNNEFGELIASELKTELESNYEDKIDNVDISSDNVEVTFKSGRMYLVGTDGSLIQPTERTGIEIGSYVDYEPDVPNTIEYPHTTLDTYSGSTKNTTDITQDILNWQVLRIYKDGSMDFIGSTTSKSIYFNGILGYTNGVYLMDDICKTLYSRNANGIEARSVDLEDFEYWLNQSTSGVSSRDSYTIDGYTYGDSATYTSHNKYPPFYKTQTSESDPGSLSTNSSYATDGDLIVEQTFYNIAINNENFLDGYKALSSSKTYWLGSRFAHCTSTNVFFGLHNTDTNIGSMGQFSSTGSSNYVYNNRLRPVVHLKSTAQITANAGTTSEPHHIESY